MLQLRSRMSVPLGAPVPGPYQVDTSVPAVTPAECRANFASLFNNDTLCCFKADDTWSCRPVRGAPTTPTPTPPAQAPEFCLRSLQIYLRDKGYLNAADATGTWNRATEMALARQFPNPQAYPGGTCAMLAAISLDVAPKPRSTEPYWRTPQGQARLPWIVGGGVAAVALVWWLMSRGSPTP